MNNTNALRNTLGMLGILLPILSLTFNLLFGQAFNPPKVLQSISATHYASAYLLFEGLVFGTGLFLITYRGYDITDRVACIIAGCGAITLTLFPCELEGGITRNFLMLSQDITMIFHYTAAICFFVSLFFIITFQFTKTNTLRIQQGSKKWQRNMVYKICGWTMILSLVIAVLLSVFHSWDYWIFTGETIALWAFGIAWLTKGGVFIKTYQKKNEKRT